MTEVKVATVYSVECQQKLYQDCEEHRGNFNVIRRDKTVELGKCLDGGKIADDCGHSDINRSFGEMHLDNDHAGLLINE